MTRTVVITGAASGIGKAIDELLESRGYRTIGVDVHATDIIADLSTPEGRAKMVAAVKAECPDGIDGVVACAGLALAEPKTVAVNYFGAVATLEGLRPLIKVNAQSRAVVIASVAATMPHDDALVDACLSGDEAAALKAAAGKEDLIYASTKVAITRWARKHAVLPEWAGAGILLNIVAPGVIHTPMTQAIYDDKAYLEQIKQMLPAPIGRYGEPEEIAQLVGFLISPENSLMVGQMLYIDSGSEAATRGELAW